MKKRLQHIYFHWLKIKNKIFQGSPVLVLMYHRVSDVYDNENKYLTVSLSDFEQQLYYYKKHFEILRLNQDWNNKKPAVVLTFDDGYADNLYNALPLLEKYNIPATVFICTQNIGTSEEFWWDKLANIYHNLDKKFLYHGELHHKDHKTLHHIFSDIFHLPNNDKTLFLNKLAEDNAVNYLYRDAFRSLSVQELQQLAQHPLITIGLHSHKHLPMNKMTQEEQYEVFIESKTELEKYCRNYIPYFAIPHGTKNIHTPAALQKTDLQAVLLANNYYTNRKMKNSKSINRILMPSITGKKLKKHLDKYL